VKPLISIAIATCLLSSASLSAREGDAHENAPPGLGAASLIVDTLSDADLQDLINDALERNPGVAVLKARAYAAEQMAPQVGALPDPTASLTLFLLEPQTRVGPQKANAGLSQRFPWFGKLKLKEQAALLESVASWSRVDTARLELVTRIRDLYHQLQYLDREERIVIEDQSTLVHYEQLAQARYASGIGIGQTVIKLQAEITQSRTRLLDIDQRRVALVAEINALRDRPAAMPFTIGAGPSSIGALPAFESMRATALGVRPEFAEVQALIDASGLRIDLAKKNYKPDFSFGINYAWVGKRDDTAGKIIPPEGNGDDILGVTGGVNLPIWRKSLAAGVEEAVQTRLAAEESRRAIAAGIEGALAGLAHRIPLISEQLELFERILIPQAQESLRSAETAYASGTAGALDLLDAERVLLVVRIATERARTDLVIAAARLEGVLAFPLEPQYETEERHDTH